MKYVRGLLVVLLLGSMAWSSEGPFFESARLSGQYLQMLQGRQTVQSASGPGFGAAFTIPLGQRLGLELGLGYYTVGIDQDSALQQWDWEFYDEYYQIRTANSADEFDILQESNQQITIIPFSMLITSSFRNTQTLSPFVSAGLGVYYYKRNFWLDETWGKEYELLSDESYYYEYSFNNFSKPKKGWVYSLIGETGLDIYLKNDLALFFSVCAQLIPDISVAGDGGFQKMLFGSDYTEHLDNFPFRSTITFSGGFRFSY